MIDFQRRQLPLQTLVTLAAVLSLLPTPSLRADITAPMFSSNMVLQQQTPLPIFGSAAPNEPITVTFHDQTKTTHADASGKWLLKLDPLPPGGPFDMTIQAANKLSLTNVMVGEVWLCAGQSNMGYSMKKIGGKNIDEAAHANNPDIRIVTMTRGQPPKWEPLTPDVALKSSATAYYFSKDLYASLHQPLGLIVASSPGTSIRYWVDPATIAADPTLAKSKSVGKWFNLLVKPVIPYAIRGAIWYQGESDTDANPQEYQSRFESLIKNYRAAWGQGDFPFLFVQLPKFGQPATAPGASSQWATMRQSQAAALSLPNTAMAITIDTGDKDYHPEDKWDVGKRLALLALKQVYHHADIPEDTGPTLQSADKKDGTVTLHFTHADSLVLNQPKDAPTGFELAGPDNLWHWAKATLENNTILLTSDAVKDPTQARYAWADWPIATPLFNAAGLPAAPFQVEIKP